MVLAFEIGVVLAWFVTGSGVSNLCSFGVV